VYGWDPLKNLQNLRKHGISFEEARDHLFEKENLIVPNVAYSKEDEVRHAVIGKYKGKFYVGIFTITNKDIRIISVRRARDDEEKQAKAKGF